MDVWGGSGEQNGAEFSTGFPQTFPQVNKKVDKGQKRVHKGASVSMVRFIRISIKSYLLCLALFGAIKKAFDRGFEIQALVIIRRAVEELRTIGQGY